MQLKKLLNNEINYSFNKSHLKFIPKLIFGLIHILIKYLVFMRIIDKGT